ncbi:putative bacteriocin precursor [Clostridium botulinum]|uniref:Putative bacteriocin n=1 Tax=Clostridium botulinum TaxID=1491 RepID=A0A6B4S5J2_CLOBO|nr:CLI_3235 family bacteriocin precursor [Clostridium botulinum]NFE59416.1 putative bacteriocin precursor [Clostridium botulinum]NFE74551.1 putative bacteriocin precursor [Clostridium botulinum]NFE94785.1 putative bacteriocin precursor [Clostridium botulinum]NFF88954.1 putative bacteriocin precursor [Clostridium botulinum]NFG11422.1 putative bacteriocin precursor [Clostridium botulinum]
MKKLGKKRHELIETIEAYGCHCNGDVTCNCDDIRGAFKGNNDHHYNVAYRSDKED